MDPQTPPKESRRWRLSWWGLCLVGLGLILVGLPIRTPQTDHSGGFLFLTRVTDRGGREELVPREPSWPLGSSGPNEVVVLYDLYPTRLGCLTGTAAYVVFRAPAGQDSSSFLRKHRASIERRLRADIPGSVPFPVIRAWISGGARRAQPNTGQELTGFLESPDLAVLAGVVMTLRGLWRGRERIRAALYYSRTSSRVARSCCPECGYAVDPSWQRLCPECGHELHGYDWPGHADQMHSL